MRGTICKRKGGYAVVLEISPDPTTGKRRQKWHSGYRTRKEAEAARVELVGQYNKGTYVNPPKKVTLATFLRDDWLPAQRVARKATTYESYRDNCVRHIIPVLGGLQLQAIRPVDLAGFYTAKLAAGLSPKSVANLHGILHKVLGDAMGLEYISRNVAAVPAARPPKHHHQDEAPKEQRVWAPNELGRFLTAMQQDRLYAAWALLATTGMRRGEILGLRWVDVHLDAGRVVVQQARVRAGNAVVTSTPKTSRSRRVIALDPQTATALRAWQMEQAEERSLIGARYVDSGLVVTMPDGRPVTPNRFSLWFRKHVARLGLPTIRLHDVRHSYATAALAAGVAPKVVSERLGHATIAITMDRYSHVLPAMDSQAAGTVAELIYGGTG
jgi:integrase